MFYVEWLRVRNALRCVAICFAILFVLIALVRIGMGSYAMQQYGWVDREMTKPGVHVTKQRLADGSTSITIDDPKNGDHIVVVDRGWMGREITISGRDITADRNVHVQVGSVAVRAHPELSGDRGASVQINTDEPVPAMILLAIASFVGLIVATMLGAPLAKENTNHLEIAWTKPIGRWALAMGTFGVDIAGIVGAMLLACLFAIAATALFEMPRIGIDSQTTGTALLCILSPIAWYALLTAATASMRRAYGPVLGLAWFAALVAPALAALSRTDVTMLRIVGYGFGVLTLLDPVAYLHFSQSSASGNAEPVAGYVFGLLSAPAIVRALVLFILALAYSAIALLQWRRLEA